MESIFRIADLKVMNFLGCLMRAKFKLIKIPPKIHTNLIGKKSK